MENEYYIGQNVAITTDKGTVQGEVVEYYESILLGRISPHKETVLDTTDTFTVLPPDPDQEGVGESRINLAVKVILPNGERQNWMFTSKNGKYKNVKPVIDGEVSDAQPLLPETSQDG